jgi:hypothetical protein
MKIFCTVFLLCLSLVLAGCGPQSIHKIKQELNVVTGSADAAVKANHTSYESGLYGPVGSDKAVAIRVKNATFINSVLVPISIAVEVSRSMTAANFSGSKAQIIQLLQTAVAAALQHPTGNPDIDLAVQAIAASLNTALLVIQSLTAIDVHAAPANLFSNEAVALNEALRANKQEVCPCV